MMLFRVVDEIMRLAKKASSRMQKMHSRIQKDFEVVAVMRHHELLRAKFISWQNDWTITFNSFANGVKPRESTKEVWGKTRDVVECFSLLLGALLSLQQNRVEASLFVL